MLGLDTKADVYSDVRKGHIVMNFHVDIFFSQIVGFHLNKKETYHVELWTTL